MMSSPLFQVTRSLSGKRWVERAYDPMVALKLKQTHGVSEIIARILASRGQTHASASAFLNPTIKELLPDPLHLKDMDKALQRLQTALLHQEKIAIFGDYDVDGATSSALLYRFFQMIGVEVSVYIPDRMTEGYGPNGAALSRLKDQGVRVVITVDCGTTAFEALSHAKHIGLDVIVLDHHVAEPKLPEAIAVINPNRLDEESPLKTVAAVGMSFILVVALNRALRQAGWYKNTGDPDLLSLLDLVALGTVCDVMPLQGLNRAFVKQGLKVMAQRRNLGLKLLADLAGVAEKPSAYHLGYILGPRINAGGRVGEAGLGSLLLRSDHEMLCRQAAEKLHHYNEERKAIEEGVLQEAKLQALNQLDRPTIMVAGQGWHPGVIGIVAGRLKELYNRPTSVIALDEKGLGKGSCRSVSDVDMGAMIHAAKQLGLILEGGGHAMAGGFSLTQAQLNDFHNFLDTRVASQELDPTPLLLLDGALSLQAAHVPLIRELESLAPYGMGNPTPRFAFGYLRIVKSFIVGQQHVKCIFKQQDGTSLEGIAFRCVSQPMGDMLLNVNSKPVHVAGTLGINTWMDNEKPQILIDDVASIIDV